VPEALSEAGNGPQASLLIHNPQNPLLSLRPSPVCPEERDPAECRRGCKCWWDTGPRTLPAAAGQVLSLAGSSTSTQPAWQPSIPTAGTQVPCRASSVLLAQWFILLSVLPNFLNPVGKTKNDSLLIFG